MQRHSVTVDDADARQGTCTICGPTWLKRRVRRGRVEWSCGTRHSEYNRVLKRRLALRAAQLGNPTDRCWACGFVAEDKEQLDVHHLDEDHGNNALDNLWLLCANCHRLWHSPLAAARVRAFFERNPLDEELERIRAARA